MTPTPSDEQRLLDAIADGVVYADSCGIVTRVNAAAARMLRVSDGVGRHLSDVVALQDRLGNDWYTCSDPYAEAASELDRKRLRIRSGLAEQSWLLADGTELLVTARILRDVPGGLTRDVVVSLRTSRARERLDLERSHLVAMVAHELRSPLTGVKGFVASLLRSWASLNDETKLMILQTVNSFADLGTRLIEELLDVARIDTGRLSLDPRPVDAAAAVETVLASIRAGTGKEIVFDVEGEIPQIYADEGKFFQVVTNLVDNAVRHGRGRVHLTATSLANDAPFPGLRLDVDDQGDGIRPEDRRRVFQRSWTHGPRAGLGLGLYVVHGLVTAHGGVVEIGEAPGGGARITVMWPAVDGRFD